MKIKRDNRQIPPGSRLYNSLFVDRTYNEILNLISQGLVSVKSNAERLVNDSKLLLESRRFASARFILTTADEEMAKAYILLDMCRLDFLRQESVLRRLCKAFYGHIEKYAYNAIHRFGRIYDMARAKDIWESETKKLWPGDLESGEPDFPHDTYFLREMPLYVDFIENDQNWFVPNDSFQSFYFEEDPETNVLSITLKYLEKLNFSDRAGLFETKCLKVFNECFRNSYIKEDWNETDLSKIYIFLAEKLIREFSIPADSIINSIYMGWPLYHFLTST